MQNTWIGLWGTGETNSQSLGTNISHTGSPLGSSPCAELPDGALSTCLEAQVWGQGERKRKRERGQVRDGRRTYGLTIQVSGTDVNPRGL